LQLFGGQRTKRLTLTATFGVLYMVLRMIRAFPMIGISGAFFSTSDMMAPLYGIILGPYIGASSIVLGTFVAIALGRPPVFAPFPVDFLPATMNAMLIGFLVKRKWILSAVFYIVPFLLFLAHPYTMLLVPISNPSSGITYYVPFAWVHCIALVALVSPLSRRATDWVTGSSKSQLFLGLAVLSFIGTFAQHLTGNLLYETYQAIYLGNPLEALFKWWSLVFWIYPIERTIIVIGAAVFGTALIRALRAAGLANFIFT
jgi:hypothetical protein